MVFKKEQPTSNVVVGKKEKLSTRLQRKAQNSTRKERIVALVVLGVILVFSLIAVYVYGEFKGAEIETEQQKYTAAFINSDDSDESKAKLVSAYSQQYTSDLKAIKSSDPTQWDREMVDKASAILLYADKMVSTAQVSYTLISIDLAKASGVDVDDNSYGVNEDIRSEIKQRNEERIEQAQKNSEGQN